MRPNQVRSYLEVVKGGIHPERSELRGTAEGKQHDNPAGKVHDTSAGDNETTTCTHDAHTPEDVTNVKDGVCSATRTQQATSHNSNQFSVNHT